MVTGLLPSSGFIQGGDTVVITGSKLTGATAVSFGGTPAASFHLDSATQIAAVSPNHGTGTVDVLVTTPSGTTATSAASKLHLHRARHPHHHLSLPGERLSERR